MSICRCHVDEVHDNVHTKLKVIGVLSLSGGCFLNSRGKLSADENNKKVGTVSPMNVGLSFKHCLWPIFL